MKVAGWAYWARTGHGTRSPFTLLGCHIENESLTKPTIRGKIAKTAISDGSNVLSVVKADCSFCSTKELMREQVMEPGHAN